MIAALSEAFTVNRRSVVITGLGVVTPIGVGQDPFWMNLLSGLSGIEKISSLESSSFPSQIAGEVKDFDPKIFFPKNQLQYSSRVTQFTCASAMMAMDDAKLHSYDPRKMDVILGSASCAFDEVEKQMFSNPTGGKEWVENTFDKTGLGRVFINAPACTIAMLFGIKGHITTLSSACASSLNAIGIAAQRIEDGRSDIALAGGGDCGINYFSLNLFSSAGALSTNNSRPKEALCPFDKRRTRSVLAEAAAVFVLEEKQHALDREASIYGEILEFNQEYENNKNPYAINKDGLEWSRLIEKTVGSHKSKIGFINAHGPSDIDIDYLEGLALKRVFGSKLENIPVSSIKGATGSALGATSGLQVASSALALKNKILPPTCNYRFPDPKCGLNIVDRARSVDQLSHVLINCRGFGGINSALVLGEVTESD